MASCALRAPRKLPSPKCQVAITVHVHARRQRGEFFGRVNESLAGCFGRIQKPGLSLMPDQQREVQTSGGLENRTAAGIAASNWNPEPLAGRRVDLLLRDAAISQDRE